VSSREAIVAIVGLAAITLLTRAFFLIPDRDLPLPAWLREGLRYTPLAALVAVAVPEVLLTDGLFLDTWRDAKLWSVAAATAYYFWRRGILGTIVTGTAAMLAMRIGLGW